MVQYSWKFVISRNIPVGVYLLKVNNRNTFEENKWIVDFRHISHLILVFIVNVEHVIAGWGITLLLRHFNGDISSQNVRAWLQNIKKNSKCLENFRSQWPVSWWCKKARISIFFPKCQVCIFDQSNRDLGEMLAPFPQNKYF